MRWEKEELASSQERLLLRKCHCEPIFGEAVSI
jgi:hypothetical protein